MLKPRLKRTTVDRQTLLLFAEALKRHFSDRVLEMVTSLLLATAGVGTSWSGYEAARWSGIQAASYNRATGMRLESARFSTEAGQLIIIDVSAFMQWLQAWEAGEERLQHFYRTRFRPEFSPAFEAWVASDPKNNPAALPTPFQQPEYKLLKGAKSRELESRSVELFARGQDANQISDNYVLNTVILAMVMFLCSVAQQFRRMEPRIFLLLTAAAITTIGLVNFLHYPIARL